jgi:hypothetical protein
VPVDVNVIDKSGRPVPDQAAGDFTLTVDGKPRRAVSAQFISVDRAVDRVPPSKPMETLGDYTGGTRLKAASSPTGVTT